MKIENDFSYTSVQDKSVQEIPHKELITNIELFMKYPEEVKTNRSKLINLTLLQMGSCTLSVLYLFLYESAMCLLIDVFTLILSLIGLIGAIKMNNHMLYIHYMCTTSVTGFYFLYQIMTLLFVKKYEDNSANENWLMVIFSLPYAFNFYVGMFSSKFLTRLIELNQELSQKNLTSINVNDNDKASTKKCLICQKEKIDSTFNDCGHEVNCQNCNSKLLRSFGVVKCGLCEKDVKSYKKL